MLKLLIIVIITIKEYVTFGITLKNGKDTFIFSERIESTHTQMIGKNGLTVFQRDGSAKMTTIPGNHSEGTETIVYKCIAIAAGDHVEFNPKK